MNQLSMFGIEDEISIEDTSLELGMPDDCIDMNTPLASRLRPRDLDEYVGQSHLVGEGQILRQLIEKDQVNSMIFFGPPGVGKTTLARIIANKTKSLFINFSAVTSGIKEIKEVMKKAEEKRKQGRKTIVFVDEIHRFNKSQQDAFLPYVEKGSIILIGATTENPSFEINSALLSRLKVFVLKPLGKEDILKLINHALEDKKGFGNSLISIDEDCKNLIAAFADSDARTALNTLEMAVLNGNLTSEGSLVVTKEIIEQCIGKKALLYDKDGEEHYNMISALHKSMRNSDPDASIYWLARMLEAGENPLYVARRVVRFASEDVGLADSNALQVAINAYQACHYIGMPECSVNLSQAVVYMAMAPKSNAMEVGYLAARDDALKMLSEPVPLHLRNGVTNLMREMDYGKGYKYAHDFEDKITTMQCMPDIIKDHRYYEPAGLGAEKELKERLEEIRKYKSTNHPDK